MKIWKKSKRLRNDSEVLVCDYQGFQKDTEKTDKTKKNHVMT